MKNIFRHFLFQSLVIVLYSDCIYCTSNMEGYKYEIDEEPLNFGSNKQLDGVTTYKLVMPDSVHHNVLDLALVFDSSYTITTTGWYRIKKAAKQFIDSLDISPQGTHVSIMKYSTDVETFRIFEQNADKEKLKTEIDEMTYDGEWSRLDLALKAVDEHVFAADSGARLGDVPKAVVLFTDGKADGPTQPDEEVDWHLKVLEAAQSLKKKHVIVYAVSVGGFADQSALEAITGSAPAPIDFEDEANSSGRIFDLNDIAALTKTLTQLSVKIPAVIGGEASLVAPATVTTTSPAATQTETATVTPTPSLSSSSVSPSISSSLPLVVASSSSPSSSLEASSSLAPSSASPSSPLEASSSLAPSSASPSSPLEASSSLAPSSASPSSPLEASSSLAPSSATPSSPLEASSSVAPSSASPSSSLEASSSLASSISPSPSISSSALISEPTINNAQPIVTSTVITTVVLTTTLQVTETTAAPESTAAPELKESPAIVLTINHIAKRVTEKRQKRSAGASRRWYHKYIPRFIKRWIPV